MSQITAILGRVGIDTIPSGTCFQMRTVVAYALLRAVKPISQQPEEEERNILDLPVFLKAGQELMGLRFPHDLGKILKLLREQCHLAPMEYEDNEEKLLKWYQEIVKGYITPVVGLPETKLVRFKKKKYEKEHGKLVKGVGKGMIGLVGLYLWKKERIKPVEYFEFTR